MATRKRHKLPSKRKYPVRFELVYQGFDWKEAERAGFDFWKNASIGQRLLGIKELIEHEATIRGWSTNELRLLRSTAIIKRQ